MADFNPQDVPELIRYPPRASHAQISSHQSTYRFATVLSIPLAISLLLFWLITRFRSASVVQWEIIPNLYLLFLVVAFAYPSRIAQNGRRRFLLVLRRVSIGGIAETGDGRFGDILMADVLTSYAKVLADLFVALCMMVSRQHSTAKPDRGCGGTLVVPILLSIPSLIRLRQCMVEYFRVRRTNMAGGLEYGSQGWGGQHLANALKYASAFPVIVLSSLKRGSDPANIGLTENTLRALWSVERTLDIQPTLKLSQVHSGVLKLFLLILLGCCERLGLTSLFTLCAARPAAADAVSDE